jgi:alginate O-acetyltransferase complex protein AlgI
MILTLGLIFVVLLLCVLAGYLPSVKGRQILLLLASYLFYGSWGIGFLVALIMSSLMNHICGIVLRRKATSPRLWIGIAINLLPLAFFKYLPPLLELGSAGAWPYDLARQITMPVGMSFWTFQGLSYLLDIYLDIYPEEQLNPSWLEFCLYMAFWPTVLSGPVCRLPQMLPQFHQHARVSWEDVSAGSLRVIQGLTMKFVLAQILASGWMAGAGITAGFDQVQGGWGGVDVWLLGMGYGFLLFFDFAGYSHMVIGTARIFAIRVPENFDRPFLSMTPSIFWTRWHMSLSFWIRDYLFNPLATASRRYAWGPYAGLVTSMTLFGLWHGAKATFIVYGVYHGLLLVMHRLGQQMKRRWSILRRRRAWGGFLSWGTTFLLISLGFVCFRANSLNEAVSMGRSVFSPSAYRHFAMPRDFYMLTSAIIIGYFVWEWGWSLLLSWQLRYRQAMTELAQPTERLPLVSWRRLTLIFGALFEFLGSRLWWWFAPAVAILTALVGLVIYQEKAAIPVTPFIYTLF